MNKGSNEARYAERVYMNSGVGVLIERSAFLDESLSAIEERYLYGIMLVVREGYDEEICARLDKRDAESLRDALSDALNRTDGEWQ